MLSEAFFSCTAVVMFFNLFYHSFCSNCWQLLTYEYDEVILYHYFGSSKLISVGSSWYSTVCPETHQLLMLLTHSHSWRSMFLKRIQEIIHAVVQTWAMVPFLWQLVILMVTLLHSTSPSYIIRRAEDQSGLTQNWVRGNCLKFNSIDK